MVEVPNCTSQRSGCDQRNQVEEELYRNIVISLRLGIGLGYLVGDHDDRGYG